jgi:glycosyltransferase involved in cell wall biosynthesis
VGHPADCIPKFRAKKLPPTKLIVSAIVPARNEEENIAASVESLAAQPEIAEIIVVNDQSTDRTGAILDELAGRISRLHVMESRELPDGWVGKNYALSLGAAEAQNDWFLFTDADATHLPGSTATALKIAEEAGAALVSFSPEQRMETWWERALLPFIFSRLADKFRYRRINDPDSPVAAANGQYLMIRRDAYHSIGGHTGVSGEVLEDVEIARRVKKAGYRIYFGPGIGIARTRMYRTFGAMWQGWSKNLYPLMAGSFGRFVGEVLTVFPGIPVIFMLLALIFRHMPSSSWRIPHSAGLVLFVLGIGLLAARHAAYASKLRSNRFSTSGILYYIPAVFLYCAALTVSAWRYSRGSVIWKGREYRVGMARRP